MKSCRHCHTSFSPRRAEEEFCCHGCEYVFRLINDSGLDQFYQLKQGLATTPVKSRPFEEHDFSWLAPLVLKAEVDATEEASLDLALDGISCIGCVWMIETIFARDPGSVRAAAHPTQGLLHLEWLPGRCDIAGFLREIAQFGYIAMPKEHQGLNRDFAKLTVRTGLCGAFALNAMAFSLPSYLGMPAAFVFADLFQLIAFLSATFAMLVGGTWFIQKAWHALRRKTVHLDLPIALGLLAAYAGSIVGWQQHHDGLLYFDFVATFVFLMLVGRSLQTSAIERNRVRLNRQRPVPSEFDSPQGSVVLEEIVADVPYQLRPGQANPVAAVLTGPETSFSLEWINGEADPVSYRTGSRLPAGAILLSRNPASLMASESWRESLLARLTAPPVEERGHAFLDRLLRYWIAVILWIGISGFVWHAWHHQWIQGLQVMISVFVVSCPCALGVAIPLADDLAATQLQRWGVFLRSTTFWSRILRVKKIIFDKTGTLTRERPLLENPDVVDTLRDDAASALARMTHGSLHPISRTLLEQLGHRGQKLLMKTPHGTLEETPGMGVTWVTQEHCWSLGRPGWKDQQSDASHQATVLACDETVIARFAFRDSLRPSAHATIKSLLARDIKVYLCSGDHLQKVAMVANHLGISPSHAVGELTPEEKAEFVRGIDTRDTLYLGDGANDSLAFDLAYVTGTPVTDRSLLESKADFYTLGTGLSYLTQMFHLAQARDRGVKWAFAFALLYNVTVITISLLGHMNPLLAAIVMPLSSLVSLMIVALFLKNPFSKVEQAQEISYSDVDVNRDTCSAVHFAP